MSWLTLFSLLFVTAGSTLIGSLPVIMSRPFSFKALAFWESFGGGVMLSASLFSLYLPAFEILQNKELSFLPLLHGSLWGFGFIFLVSFFLQTKHHSRAFLVFLAMGLHNVPEGMAVGVDVAALGWQKATPLAVAIFIQNIPEGLVTGMSFLLSGFSARASFFANGVTAIIEGVSALLGYKFVIFANLGLPFLLSFSGACMISVVMVEFLLRWKRREAASLSWPGFIIGLCVCAILDLVL